MSYNTDFKVKYHEIEQELLEKNKSTTEYDNQDILDICEKLYRDELISVFNAENLYDDKIDFGMKDVYNKLILNKDFNNFFEEMKNILFTHESINTPELNDEQRVNFTNNSDFIILLSLFSQPNFYITHTCICQQFKSENIDHDLLSILKNNTIQLLIDKYSQSN
jgi:type III secretory pathway component EscV